MARQFPGVTRSNPASLLGRIVLYRARGILGVFPFVRLPQITRVSQSGGYTGRPRCGELAFACLLIQSIRGTAPHRLRIASPQLAVGTLVRHCTRH